MTRQEFIDSVIITLSSRPLDAGQMFAMAESLWEEREKRILSTIKGVEWRLHNKDTGSWWLDLYNDHHVTLFPIEDAPRSYFVWIDADHTTLEEIELVDVSLEEAKAEAMVAVRNFINTIQAAVGVHHV